MTKTAKISLLLFSLFSFFFLISSLQAHKPTTTNRVILTVKAKPPKTIPLALKANPPKPIPLAMKAKTTKRLLLRGGILWTATGQILRNADILIEDQRIKAVGRSLSTEGAQIVDVTGKHITPGLIDTHSHMGVYPSPGASAHADGNEMASPTTPYARAEYGFWPQDPALPRAVEGGVTTAQILPGSANLIGGRSMIIRLRLARTAQAMRFPNAPHGLKMACGENPKRVYRTRGLMTRMGNIAKTREAFQKALEYKRRWAQYHEDREAWEKRQKTMPPSSQPATQAIKKIKEYTKALAQRRPQPPAKDLGLETLRGVLEGKILVHIHCYRADEMAWMLDIAREFGFRIRSFHHAVEAYKIRDILKKEGVAVSVWADWWGFKMESFDAIEENAALMASSGGITIIHSDSSTGIQRLNQEAAKAYYRGLQMGLKLTEDQAIRWITRNPAWALGIEHEVGTLEAGKRADIVIWDRHPFSVYARAEQVFLDGETIYHQKKPRQQTDFEVGMYSAPLTPSLPKIASQARLPFRPITSPRPTMLPPANKPTSAKGSQHKNAPSPVLLRQATLYTMEGKPYVGDILFQGKTILRVGRKLDAPQGTEIIDATGKIVMPGFAIAQTGLGLVEVMAETSTRNDEMKAASPIRAGFRAYESFRGQSITLPIARRSGITSAEIAPRGGLLSGLSGYFGIHGSESPRIEPFALHGGFGSGWMGSSAHAWLQLREALAEAELYQRHRHLYPLGKLQKLGLSAIHLDAIALTQRKDIPLVLTLQRSSDIRRAIAFAKQYGVRLILSGAAEGWLVAKEIAAAKIPVLLHATDNLPRSFDRLHSRHDNAALLAKAGVTLAFSAHHDAHFLRGLRQDAGILVAHGLPHHTALKALTAGFFDAFGIQAHGRLKAGYRADIVLWDGDPLEHYARPLRIWINGRSLHLTSRQTLLRDRYRHLPLRR